MTYRPLHIKELLGHILSFIPKRDIHLYASTCKSFYEAIPIIQDQKLVAELGDMFSLKKIAYSPKIVMSIACCFNNVKIVNYLTNKLLVNQIYFGMSQAIGFSGNEDLINKINDKYPLKMNEVFLGICEAGHVTLFDKYLTYYENEFWPIF